MGLGGKNFPLGTVKYEYCVFFLIEGRIVVDSMWHLCGESLLVETAAELAGKDDDCDWLG